MSKFINNYDIKYAGLKQGHHEFEFEARELFFDTFDYSEFKEGEIKITVDLEKQSTMLVLDFVLSGWVLTTCDRCGEDMQQTVEGEFRLIIKFGDEEIEESDEILVLPHAEHKVNVSRYIYEYIVVSVPQRRVHTDDACNADVMSRLNNIQPESQDEPIDPRWAALSELKKKKDGTS